MAGTKRTVRAALIVSALGGFTHGFFIDHFSEVTLVVALGCFIFGVHFYVLIRKIRIQMKTGKWVQTGYAGNQKSGWSANNSGSDINPATGLPMIGCVDVRGNPFGVNHDDD